MTTQTKVAWRGQSGTTYEYTVYTLDTNWNDTPGNYIFAKRNAQGAWVAIYIGETESLKNRLTTSHEKWACAVRNGVTHMHAHVSSSVASVRRAEESDLIARYKPICNG